MITGTQNTINQRERLTRGRAEYARIMTERAEKDAIKYGRVYRDFAGALVSMPQHAPFPKPHYRGHDYGAVVEMKDARIIDTSKWAALGKRIRGLFRRESVA